MRLNRIFIAVQAFTLLAAGAIAPGHAQQPPPAQAFGMLEAIGDASLNPNGERVAWSDQTRPEVAVVVTDLANKRELRRIAVGAEYKLRGITWADDDTLLLTMSQTETQRSTEENRYRLEYYRTIAVDMVTGQASVLLMGGGARGLVSNSRIERLNSGKPRSIIMSSLDYSAAADRGVVDSRFERSRRDVGWIDVLFEVDTRSGKGKILERGTQFTDQWVVDGRGNLVGRSEWNPEGNGYRVLARRDNRWTEIFARPKGPTLIIAGVNAAGTAMVARGPNDAGRSVVFEIPLDGSGARILFEDPRQEVESIILDRFTSTPVAAVLEGPEKRRHWFDNAARARTESLMRTFKGRNVRVYDESRDGTRVLARVDGPAAPAVYYLVDFAKRSADIVGEEYPALMGAKLGEVRSISYKARDGQDIPALLTLPPGSTGKGHSLVVLVHGGPHSHDRLAFDYWAQFMATRGYAVLQPQFRGSTGYGSAFEAAGFRQWGGLMQDDVTDGVRAMLAEGVANPGRVCIAGASYGGYAALAGVAFTPDLYRCGISYAGIANIPQILASDRTRLGKDHPDYLEFERRVGDPLDPQLAARSPVKAAERIVAPVLLIHGVDDIVVPIAQSDGMASAMGANNPRLKYIKFPGEDHWLSRAATRLRLLQEVESFLAEHLPK